MATVDFCLFQMECGVYTVNEWLQHLRLPQYIQTFHSHGFDNMQKIMKLRPIDLDSMKVRNSDHRELMLTSINK